MKNNKQAGPQVGSSKKENKLVLVLIFVFTLLVSMQVATQLFAYNFQYQDGLGANIAHIYAPWSIFVWANDWYHIYPNEFMKSATVGVVLATAGFILLAVTKFVMGNSSRVNKNLHGSARWAEKKDIQEAGLLPKPQTKLEIVKAKDKPTLDGVYVGGWEDANGEFHYLRHSGPEHVLTYAPTRSGKGVGLVVPTLLSWASSAVITDLKGELWALTAGWRKNYANNKVLRFEPASMLGSVKWNPLDEIRLGTENEVGDVQNLATLIVDPDGKGLVSHWEKTSFSLLVGVILHALYKAKEDCTKATLPSVDFMLSDPSREVSELWMEMATYGHINGENHPAVGTAGRDMMDRPDEEAGSVLSTAKSYLSLYRDPVVAENVSTSEFKIKDLMHNDDPVSLYIVTQPNDKGRLKPLVRIMVNMIIRLLADKMDFEGGRPKAHYKHRLLGMIDEFPSLGKLEIMQESLAFVAGYGMKFYLICQDLNQLKSRETGYGPDETITSNCHVQNAYPPNRIETAEHLSKLSGQTTIIKEQVTTSGKRTSAMHGQVSRTIQEVQRPLLTPDECLRMPGPKKNAKGEIEEAGDMVIYVAGYPAIYGKQPLYFKDPVFLKRASVEPPKDTDRIKKIEEKSEVIDIA